MKKPYKCRNLEIQWSLSYLTLQLSNPMVCAFQLVPMCAYNHGKYAHCSASISVYVLPVFNICDPLCKKGPLRAKIEFLVIGISG